MESWTSSKVLENFYTIGRTQKVNNVKMVTQTESNRMKNQNTAQRQQENLTIDSGR